jgi:hypothetical protein
MRGMRGETMARAEPERGRRRYAAALGGLLLGFPFAILFFSGAGQGALKGLPAWTVPLVWAPVVGLAGLVVALLITLFRAVRARVQGRAAPPAGPIVRLGAGVAVLLAATTLGPHYAVVTLCRQAVSGPLRFGDLEKAWLGIDARALASCLTNPRVPGDELARYAAHPDSGVRAAVAGNSSLPRSVLDRWVATARSGGPPAAAVPVAALASNPALTAEQVYAIALMPNASDFHSTLARNPGISPGVLKWLSLGASPGIRDEVGKNLKARGLSYDLVSPQGPGARR